MSGNDHDNDRGTDIVNQRIDARLGKCLRNEVDSGDDLCTARFTGNKRRNTFLNSGDQGSLHGQRSLVAHVLDGNNERAVEAELVPRLLEPAKIMDLVDVGFVVFIISNRLDWHDTLCDALVADSVLIAIVIPVGVHERFLVRIGAQLVGCARLNEVEPIHIRSHCKKGRVFVDVFKNGCVVVAGGIERKVNEKLIWGKQEEKGEGVKRER